MPRGQRNEPRRRADCLAPRIAGSSGNDASIPVLAMRCASEACPSVRAKQRDRPILRQSNESFALFATTDGKDEKSKEAERRETRILPSAPSRCGARRSLRARLSAFHHGACCSERTPQLSPSYALPGTERGRSGRYPLPAVLQYSGLETADRSSCRPGVYAGAARERR
jgi:hypothetical protein